MNVLLTGGTGFLGNRLSKKLHDRPNFHLTAATRNATVDFASKNIKITDLAIDTDWALALQHQHVIIHTAARAHIRKDELADPLSEYRKVNVEGTLNLARQAVIAGVKRFIFISSIGVNGNISTQPFTEDDEPKPTGPYAQSKWEAERGLWEIQRETGMELVIIRPPLVYGPSAPGNFGSLMRWVQKGIPLPLGAVHNQRSLVALDNLVDLIITCIDHPAAANQLFLIGDGEDVSTTELLQGVAQAAGRPSRLLPVPASLLQFGATMLGKKAVAQQLLGSLQVDISKARTVLGWAPPLTVEQGLKRCFDDSTI